MDLQPYGRGMMIMGLILVAVGAVFWLSPRVPWIGHLPGDVFIQQRDGVTFYFPVTSSVLVSLLLSAILWLVGRMK